MVDLQVCGTCEVFAAFCGLLNRCILEMENVAGVNEE
jgi:hypothetical protein